MPDEFIPIMENSESMITLGYWGIKRAFSILAHLESLGMSGYRIAVNLSASQFLDPNLINFMREQLAQSDQGADQIELELTERTVVADIEQTKGIMHQLKALGFSFSIDDFGTGYCSLSYLETMQFDCLKIDRLFVEAIDTEAATNRVVLHIINMARTLDMKLIAEGVETEAQANYLKSQGVEFAQGWLFSRAIAPDEFLKGLA